MEQEEFDSLDKTILFIKEDTQGCLNYGVNVSLALILSAYTEFFGHLLTGNSSSGDSYNAWLRFMGTPYSTLLDKGHDLFDDIRCGLIHEYTIKRRAHILTENDGSPGIEIEGDIIYFNNYQYQKDFIDSIDRYREKIKTDMTLQENYTKFTLTKPIVV